MAKGGVAYKRINYRCLPLAAFWREERSTTFKPWTFGIIPDLNGIVQPLSIVYTLKSILEQCETEKAFNKGRSGLRGNSILAEIKLKSCIFKCLLNHGCCKELVIFYTGKRDPKCYSPRPPLLAHNDSQGSYCLFLFIVLALVFPSYPGCNYN